MKRPYQQLPIPLPSEYDPSENCPNYFYDNFIQFFIEDSIKMMNTGICLDEDSIEILRKDVEKILGKVLSGLENNKIIQDFQKYRHTVLQKEHKTRCIQSIRTKEYYSSNYDSSNILHRTWVINTYFETTGKSHYKEKWTIRDLKTLNNLLGDDPFLKKVIDKTISSDNEYVIKGMEALAQYKADLWNKPRYDKAELSVSLPEFNPGSAKQKQELFKFLNIEPLEISKKTGNASWGRDQIEALTRTVTDRNLLDVLGLFIDYSYGKIIQSNFLKAFDSFSIDGVLYGNVRLFGAKSFRYTSNSPNLLNMPSTGSIYAKPLKRCFKAPEGRIVYTADLSALEDRVIANLSKDENKLSVFTEGLDGHSLSACYYFKDKIKKLIGEFSSSKDASILLKSLVASGNVEAKEIRQNSKPVSFGLAYGAYPPKVAQTLKISIEEAKRIFDTYHNELYPGITEYRENILSVTKKHGYVHLGLGCRLYTDDPDNDIRTLFNGTVQFWSILTLIAINEFNYRIKQKGYEGNIDVVITIYDSIYIYVDKNPEIIKWVNDNIIELMCVQYLENEIVHNEAEGEIGLNFADLYTVPNNASIKEIENILSNLE